MSRFWTAAGESDEESDGSQFTDSDQEKSDDEKNAKGSSYYLKGYVSSDSDEEVRKVQSLKDKHFQMLEDTCEKVNEALEANKWESIQEEFGKLMDQIAHARKVIKKHGIPAFVVRVLRALQERSEEAAKMTKAERRAMKKVDSKALNTMKQRIPKALKDYQRELDAFAEMEKKKAEGGDDGDGGEEDDEDDERDVQTIVIDRAEGPLEPASFYDTPTPAQRSAADAKEVAKLDQLTEILARRGKRGFDKNEQIRQLSKLLESAGSVERELTIWFHVMAAILDMTSISGQMSAHFWRQLWKALSSVVSLLNANPKLRLVEADDSLGGSALAVEIGSSDENKVTVVGNMLVLLERLDDELLKTLKLVDPHSEKYVARMRDIRLVERLAEDMHNYFERIGDMQKAAHVASIRMSHLYVKHEWVRELQYKAYVKELEESHERRKAEQEAKEQGIELGMTKEDLAAAEDEEEELEDENDGDADNEDEDEESKQARELKRIEEKIRRQAERSKPKDKPTVPDRRVLEKEPRPFQAGPELLERLAVCVFRHGDERQKTRALLYLVTSHALSDRYYEARDVLLMSHLQDTVHHMDMPTQVLYNRATVQLGLCAFRQGLVSEAHNCLSEICSGGKIKELLAQGTSTRHQDRTPEMERLERIRQLPFHMHINLDHVECAHLLSAMLLEVPNMAAGANDTRKKVISRPFRKLVDWFDRQHLSGPPENTRETIVAAARALQGGDWKLARDLVLKLRVWKLLPDAERIQGVLIERLKEEALHTHLLTYSGCYSSLLQSDLAECYELPKSTVHKVVSKMMINEELRAAWDQPTESIIMHGAEPSKLQTLALQYADKVALFVDSNERALDGRAPKESKYAGNYNSGGGGGKWQGDRSGGKSRYQRGGQRGQDYKNRR